MRNDAAITQDQDEWSCHRVSLIKELAIFSQYLADEAIQSSREVQWRQQKHCEHEKDHIQTSIDDHVKVSFLANLVPKDIGWHW